MSIVRSHPGISVTLLRGWIAVLFVLLGATARGQSFYKSNGQAIGTAPTVRRPAYEPPSAAVDERFMPLDENLKQERERLVQLERRAESLADNPDKLDEQRHKLEMFKLQMEIDLGKRSLSFMESAAAAAMAPSSTPGPPIRISEIQGNARGAVAIDTTRLDPKAAGLFLPSAIPARGEPFYGTGERCTVQGSGSSATLSWMADVGRESLDGKFKADMLTDSQGEFSVYVPQAWISWRNLLFGKADSAFTDVGVLMDTIDLGGPNSRAWIQAGTPQIRCTFAPRNSDDGMTGLYAIFSVEAPDADVYLPTAPAGTPAFGTFSEYPDFVAALRYVSGHSEINECTRKPVTVERWHLQWSNLFRDLGVDRADDSVRENAFGWGTQLTGQYTIFRNPCRGLRDFVYFSVLYGEGIGRYVNDLHFINPVNDAAYNMDTRTLTPLPAFGYFAGVTHEWCEHLRSTAVYSHLDLDSRQIPGGSTTSLPYQSGDYLSINLLYHYEPCVEDDKGKRVQHHLVAGLEYVYGEKEILGGGVGSAHRVLFMVGGAN